MESTLCEPGPGTVRWADQPACSSVLRLSFIGGAPVRTEASTSTANSICSAVCSDVRKNLNLVPRSLTAGGKMPTCS